MKVRRLFGLERRQFTPAEQQLLVGAGDPQLVIDRIPFDRLAFQVPVVWGCVKMIADRLISLPRVVVGQGGREMPSPGWLEQPNDWMDGDQMLSRAVFGLLLNGNFYAVVRRERYGGPVREVIVPDPWEVGCDWDRYSRTLVWYYQGVPYPADPLAAVSVVHQPYLTLGDEVLGVGPAQAMGLTGDVLGQAYRFMLAEFANNISGNIVIEYPDMITDQEARRVRGQLLAGNVGSSNARKPIVTSGGAQVKSLGASAKDAQLVETMREYSAQVAGIVFNVDPPLLGVNTSGVSLTYNNQQEREEKLWEDALRPVAHRYQRFVSRLLPGQRRLRLDESGLTGVTRAHALDNALKEVDLNLKAGAEIVPWEKIAESVGGALDEATLAKLRESGRVMSSVSSGSFQQVQYGNGPPAGGGGGGTEEGAAGDAEPDEEAD